VPGLLRKALLLFWSLLEVLALSKWPNGNRRYGRRMLARREEMQSRVRLATGEGKGLLPLQ